VNSEGYINAQEALKHKGIEMLLKDCEIWYLKADPKNPNKRFNPQNPTWEVQIRTEDKEVKKAWEEAGLMVKPIVPDEGLPYFRVNLRKKSMKEDGEPASLVEVIDAKLNPIDPNIVGNGSIGNVRIFQYEYPRPQGGKGLASVFMGVQITKLLVYHPKPREDDFAEEGETEIIEPERSE
jgi:hypothetical protein